MPDTLSTALAATTIVLFAAALWATAIGRLTVAGLCFLSASLTIYLRERRLAAVRSE